MMNEFVFSDLVEGHKETLSIDLRETEVGRFIALSGDGSTVHVDDEYAKSRGFEKHIVHGALLIAYMSQLIGMKLPGKHGVLRSIAAEFRKPCYAPTKLLLEGRVVRLVSSIRLAKLGIDVFDASGEKVVTASAESVLKM